MKYFIYFLFFFHFQFIYAQYTSIPDGAFEIYLINLNIDSDPIADGQILNADAEAQSSLFINAQFISDLTGLEAFNNLNELQVSQYSGSSFPIHTMDSLNELTLSYVAVNNPDLSQNLKLEKIHFSNSTIDSVNIMTNTELKYIYLSNLSCNSINFSQNLNLEILIIGNLGLDSLDISSNYSLRELTCSDSLIELDISQNPLLTYLNLNNNLLTSLDLSQNEKIRTLFMENNLFTSLDLSEQDSLEKLGLKINLLNALDVSNSSKLELLDCDSNNIQVLNLQNNHELEWINCASNNLHQLNLQNGNNSNILIDYKFDVRNNPNLTCIQVDDIAFSNNAWINKDNQSYFSLNCQYDLGVQNKNSMYQILLFPNPSDGTFHVNTQVDKHVLEIEIYNTLGQKVYFEKIKELNDITIRTNLNPGIYLVKLNSNLITQVRTMIVE